MPRLVRDGSLEVGGRTVKVSSVGKPFFPDAGLNKGDLLAYYRDVAEVMLPYLAGRPLNLQRFPNGVNGKGFWQQGASDHFPDWVRTVTVERRGRGGTVDHVVCDDAATIVYLANLATVTFHAWTSTVEQLARPDLVIIDLDPDPDQGLEVVRAAARAVKAACEDAELALLVAARDPDRLSVEWRKAKRDGRLLLDTARNGYAQTLVAPYSVRPKPEAPVATPIEWSELGRVEPRGYTVANLRRRLARKPDPWAGMAASAAAFEPVRARLDELLAEAGQGSGGSDRR